LGNYFTAIAYDLHKSNDTYITINIVLSPLTVIMKDQVIK